MNSLAAYVIVVHGETVEDPGGQNYAELESVLGL